MKVNLFNTYYPKYTIKPAVHYQLSPLQYDSVSFTSMKKSEFEGIDYAVVEKFKAPVEKFKTNDDLQNWTTQKVKEIAEKDYGGRQKETKIQRKAIINEWADYVINENDAYTPAMALLIMNFVTKDLKDKTDELPPLLNKGALADVIDEIQTTLKKNPKEQFDLGKMYKNKLRAYYLADTNTGEKGSKWVIIPSKSHDPENFEANVHKLKTLSHKNWCTKTFNAEPYLSKGDFHILLEDGMPKIGVRFIGDKIHEIQGELNNGKIPFSYYDKVKQHIDCEKTDDYVDYQMKTARDKAKKAKQILQKLKPAIKKNDTATILRYFEIGCEKDKDGKYIISHYEQPADFSLSELGINENKLFENIKKINGHADFENSQVTNLGNLQSIGGNANFKRSQVTNLGNLQSIGGNANFAFSQVTNLGDLKSIGGNAEFAYSQVTHLGNLQTIGGDAHFGFDFGDFQTIVENVAPYLFSKVQVTNLGNLKSIGGNAEFSNSQITNLGDLQSIGGDVNFCDSQVTNLGNLQSIGGNANFTRSQVTNLGNLKSIGGNARFTHSQVTNLGDLKSIGGNAEFQYSQVTNLGDLQTIGWDAYFYDSQITNLGDLKSIGGDARFSDSQITNLGNLKSIGCDADFSNSQITNLGNLKSIGCDAYFSHSQVTNLGDLKSIGGNAYFSHSQVTNLGNLQTIGENIFCDRETEPLFKSGNFKDKITVS